MISNLKKKLHKLFSNIFFRSQSRLYWEFLKLHLNVLSAVLSIEI